eukprot:gene10999-12828_t
MALSRSVNYSNPRTSFNQFAPGRFHGIRPGFEFNQVKRIKTKHKLSCAMTDKGSSSKRKASAAFVPDSFTSYLMGALRDNFDHLKTHIRQDCDIVAAKENSGQQTKQLLEELFRYLYLLADSSTDEVVRTSPSYSIDQAFHCLLLDPVLYWKVCNEILNMRGKDVDDMDMRVLPYDALGGKGDDEGPAKARYIYALVKYKETFGEDPPTALWGEYKPSPPLTIQTNAVSLPRETTLSAAPPEREQSLKDIIMLRVSGSNGKCFDIDVMLGDKFSSIIDRLAHHQQQLPKQVELTYRNMTLRGYMTPYNLNMKDGDVIECNIPLCSARKLAKKAAAAAISLRATVSSLTTASATTKTSSATTLRSTVPVSSLAAYLNGTHRTVNNTTSTTSTALPTSLTTASSLATAAAPRSSAGSGVDMDTRPKVCVSCIENLLVMGWPRSTFVKLDFYNDAPKETSMLTRDGSVLLGDVFAAYALHEKFTLANCTFQLAGVVLDPRVPVSSIQTTSDAPIQCLQVPSSFCSTITIKMVDYDWESMYIKVKTNTPMWNIMRLYAERRGVELHLLQFRFDGLPIRIHDTPRMMLMKEDDWIEVTCRPANL